MPANSLAGVFTLTNHFHPAYGHDLNTSNPMTRREMRMEPNHLKAKKEEDKRTTIYLAPDVQDILAEVRPKSISHFFNDCARMQCRWQGADFGISRGIGRGQDGIIS